MVKKAGAKKPTITKKPRKLTALEVVQGARNALAVANASVESQIQVYEALRSAAEILGAESSQREQATVFSELADSRGELMLKVVDQTLKLAQDNYD